MTAFRRPPIANYKSPPALHSQKMGRARVASLLFPVKSGAMPGQPHPTTPDSARSLADGMRHKVTYIALEELDFLDPFNRIWRICL